MIRSNPILFDPIGFYLSKFMTIPGSPTNRLQDQSVEHRGQKPKYQICFDNLGTENAEVDEKGETSSEEPNNLDAAEFSHELPVNSESKNDQETLEKPDNNEIISIKEEDKVRLSKFIF